jgi:hypothetical protein
VNEMLTDELLIIVADVMIGASGALMITILIPHKNKKINKSLIELDFTILHIDDNVSV